MTKSQQNELIRRGRDMGLKVYKEYLRGERGITIESVGENLMPPHNQYNYICLDYDTTLRAINSLGGNNVRKDLG